MFSRIGAPEIIIIAVLLILILGWKRLPDAARSLGRSMRVFKSEVHEMKQDGKSAASSETVKGETVRTDPDAGDAVRSDAVRGEPVRSEPLEGDVRGTSAMREDNSPRTDNSTGAS
jgi:sec-independent protein translocase protein TatA